MRLPHFLGLGTQKGGKTSLKKLLEQHTEVYLPPCKGALLGIPSSHEVGFPPTTTKPDSVSDEETSHP
ncbi:MAG: hypothetical protein VYE46_08655 [Cyanobacteriota bacterium]|nr:hypothetical protein [Cyanobacteriota bacterium]